MKGLGRHYSPDTRDANFPMRTLLPARAFTGVKRWWDSGAWLDQGQTGTCVGHGWAHWFEDSPVNPLGTVDPFGIYRDACLIDEWEDNDDQDLFWGTSVRAGAEVLKTRDGISSYYWAEPVNDDGGLQDVIDAVGYKGPVVMGTNWYPMMEVPIYKLWPDGLVRKTLLLGGIDQQPVGGHCYVLNGVDVPNRLFRMKNSWGRGWGSNGRAVISFGNVRRLLKEDGEACIALQVKV